MSRRELKTISTIDSLESVLREEISMYESYGKMLLTDQELMATLKIEALEENNKAKQTVLLKIQTLGQARENLVKQIAAENKISEQTVTIQEICKVVSGAESQRLMELRARLQEVMDFLRNCQEGTKLLASTSLGWINGSMASLKRMLAPSATYNLQGRVDHPSTYSGRVVAKQA